MSASATDMAVSARVRAAAVRAIAEFGRPLTVHEIELWIVDHEPDLAIQITTKCYDYLRIILSLAPATMLVKCRSLVPVAGIDQRAGFFGLPSVAYDPARWVPPNIKRRVPGRHATCRSRPHSVPVASPPILLPPSQQSPPAPKCQTVDRAAFVNAWDNLTRTVHPSDEFWAELTLATNEVRAELARGASPEEITKTMLKAHPRLNEPWIRDHVVMILIRETTRRPIEALFQPAFEALFV
jgi:hypothetical protein